MKKRSALFVVDVQNDFCPDGALQVKEGDRIVPALNRYIALFEAARLPVYFTRDWHPEKTVHFAEYGGRWPPHCVQGTKGAEFHPDLNIPEKAKIISKGDNPGQDSYSAFDGHDGEGRGVAGILSVEGIGRIYIGGLATDYCVRQTALDGLRQGFQVTVLLDAVKGVDLMPGDSEKAMVEIMEKGASTVTIDDIGIPDDQQSG